MSSNFLPSKRWASHVTTTAGLASLVLGLGLLAGAPAAEASDLSYRGSSKDQRAAGIPVPAPIPVMEHFRWYLRADLGLGMYGSNGRTSERGAVFGAQDAAGVGAPAPFGTSSAWFSDEFDTFATGGVGIGMYLTPRLRSDVTLDVRTKSNAIGNGNYVYDQQAFLPGPAPAPTGVQVRGSYHDKTEVRGTTSLLNLYYDLTDRGGFTPYVGAGVGFVVRSLQRSTSSTEALYDMTNPAAPVYMTTRTATGQGKDHVVAPAASLTAGAAYSLQSGMVLDFNYRYTYLGNVDAPSMIAGTSSTIKIGETHDHALRAGVRVNVW
ncbi:MAG: opacity family porin [Hyphomicrobiaceae bacterium]